MVMCGTGWLLSCGADWVRVMIMWCYSMLCTPGSKIFVGSIKKKFDEKWCIKFCWPLVAMILGRNELKMKMRCGLC